jgi:adenylate cyclase
VLWYSDLRGFTRITEQSPEQIIPLLDDCAEAVISAIYDNGCDVLKLIGDGTLALLRPRMLAAAQSSRATCCKNGLPNSTSVGPATACQ